MSAPSRSTMPESGPPLRILRYEDQQVVEADPGILQENPEASFTQLQGTARELLKLAQDNLEAHEKLCEQLQRAQDERDEALRQLEAANRQLAALGSPSPGLTPPPPSPLPDVQRVGWETFCRELPRLLKEAPGKWVAYRGEQQVALAESKPAVYEQLTRDGHPPSEIVVRRIEPLGPPVDMRLFRGRIGRVR